MYAIRSYYAKLSKNFTTGGYFAYGFKDKNWKYGTSLDITPLKNKENKIILAYKDDVNSTGSVTFIDGINQRSAEAYGRFTTKTMDLNKEATLGTDRITSYNVCYTKLLRLKRGSLIR